MKKGFSYRDLLLIVGIVVAVIVAVTTWVYNEKPAEANGINAPLPKKSSVLEAPREALKKLGNITHL